VVAGSNLNTALLFAALAILALIATVLFCSITTLQRLLIGDLRLTLDD
jgi:ABC-type nitrate/sulfonate/bicarbonate transport system permease component